MLGGGVVGRMGGERGLERRVGLGDAAAAGLTGRLVEPPPRGGLEEGELTCHAPQSTHGV